ncbi:MAG: restriction endonuclease subunit S [Alphaproteobacteria bacterium]|nr:restriction endonuclease subunit S [Alphaproteobacteria bacterium]
MSYQVPQHIDKDKIFIIKKSEINSRLDPKMALYNQSVQHSLYPPVKLKSLLLSKPQYGANEAGLVREHKEQARYIRITDIDENGLISLDELGATVANQDVKYILNENDIVIARSGATVGKSYIHKLLPYTCVYAGYLIRFVVDSDKILPDYLFAYTQLNPYKEWVNAIQRPSAQPNINAEEYQSLEIPLPNLSKQQEIVDYINAAYTQKQAKETEAQQLLDSIDGYLLKELEITLPDLKAELTDRVFYVNYSDLSNRLDPYYSLKCFQESFEAVHLGKYPVVSLKSLTTLITSGITPKSGGDAYVDDKLNGIPFIRSGNINIDGELDFNDLMYIRPDIHKTIMKSSQVRKNDLMIAIVGATIGQVGIYVFDNEANINQAIALVRLKDGINVEYVKELIKSSIGQLSLNRLKRPVARANINLEEIATIQVVLPPYEIQQKIANQIQTIRQQAKVLQAEGKAILEDAKRKVEQMIIGEKI